ncbi:uncharacterized protein LOC134721651 [Mytilus trossulus]|uniref:uncharacterized protein LOC134721651 n=1 Tax=Mytilus trossulus TaxID=6551 RepID=UPI003007315B
MATQTINAGMFNMKSTKGKRHNVDLCDDDEQRTLAFGWMASYNQRAVCVRILSPVVKNKMARKPKHVKFITRENSSCEGPGYKYIGAGIWSYKDFYGWLARYLEGFEISELKDEYWNKISQWIELLDYKYELVGSVMQWVTDSTMTSGALKKKAADIKLSTGQQKYLSHFGAALKCDMKNGTAKAWMEQLVQKIVQTTGNDIDDVSCVAPSNHCSSSTIIESICGDLEDVMTQMEFNAPFVQARVGSMTSNLSSLSLESCSASSSTSAETGTSCNKVSKSKVVPDLCVAIADDPGSFPLVVEMKPAYSEKEGYFQNISKLLSKLFFQDAVFGLVVTPRSYQMSAIVKHGNKLYYLDSPEIPFVFLDQNGKGKLDLNSLNQLYTFINSVLKWAFKTRCISKKVD